MRRFAFLAGCWNTIVCVLCAYTHAWGSLVIAVALTAACFCGYLWAAANEDE